eukprot:10752683-Lingulodinium_polyedra.AAC.1
MESVAPTLQPPRAGARLLLASEETKLNWMVLSAALPAGDEEVWCKDYGVAREGRPSSFPRVWRLLPDKSSMASFLR